MKAYPFSSQQPLTGRGTGRPLTGVAAPGGPTSAAGPGRPFGTGKVRRARAKAVQPNPYAKDYYAPKRRRRDGEDNDNDAGGLSSRGGFEERTQEGRRGGYVGEDKDDQQASIRGTGTSLLFYECLVQQQQRAMC